MSLYKLLFDSCSKFFKRSTLLKYGFNLSPVYRRTTGKVIHISEDISKIRIKIAFNYKNRNYANTLFGGSMFSSVDPFPMTQMMHLLGDNYVVWDKAAEIRFKIPATENLYALFETDIEQVALIKQRLQNEDEIDIKIMTKLTDKTEKKIFCTVEKTLYITTKEHYRIKLKNRDQKQ